MLKSMWSSISIARSVCARRFHIDSNVLNKIFWIMQGMMISGTIFTEFSLYKVVICIGLKLWNLMRQMCFFSHHLRISCFIANCNQQVRFRWCFFLSCFEQGAPLTEYTLRLIGSELEHFIRKMLFANEIKYNLECRVLNFSMGKPRLAIEDDDEEESWKRLKNL